MKRFFDVIFSGLLLVLFLPLLLFIALIIKCTSKGPALHISSRIGRHNVIFKMYKFRTMKDETPNVATHLLLEHRKYLTLVGSFLRKSSLDELPQLWNIIIGDMSFIGPRPALFNQEDLILLRTQHGIDALVPGLTGWAQINGRDELSIPEKVRFEVEYLERQSFMFDLKILALTFLRAIQKAGVSH